MANREESDAAEHETFPGAGALRGDDIRRGIHPVEQMVDAAIDQLAREQRTSALATRSLGTGSLGTGALTRSDALALAPRDGQALTVAARRPAHLRWKGMEVSEEFRRYAERVARGEDLPPFTGKILAEADAAFPWQAGARPGTKRRQSLRQQLVLWAGSALLIGGIGWSIFSALRSLDSDPLRRGESPLATAVFSNKPGSEARLDSTEEPALSDQIATSAGSLGTESGDEAPLPGANGPANALRGAPADKQPSSPVAAAQATTAVGKSAAGVPAPGATPKTASAGFPAPAQAAVPRAYIGLANGAPPPQGTATGLAKAGAGAGITLSAPGGATAPSATPASATLPVPVISPPSNPGANPGAISGAVAAGTSSDSKKEPGAESSAKGALLVETPSF